MDINKYLRYNNVALIDPAEEFHASCIRQFHSKGYLTSNQLSALRGWAHSTDTIERLTAGLAQEPICMPTQGTTVEANDPVDTPLVEDTKYKHWTAAELDVLFAEVEGGNIELDALATLFNRESSSVSGILYRHGEECVIRKGRVIQFERAPF